MNPIKFPTIYDCFNIQMQSECKLCFAKFTGNADESTAWILKHYRKHCDDGSIRMHPKYKDILSDLPNQLKMFEDQYV